ncbi:MAG TPA: tryptophan 2,3-dioxygenase family protein [Longimicrobiales bacterium]|nr:tryptophan 2,3-dioxygenase family protein [Longimicrobiales bacterium]
MAFGLPSDDKAPTLGYGSYLRLERLLDLQHGQSDPAHHDEMLFIVIHQVYELWFKQILHELDAVVDLLAAGDPLEAHRLLRRCIEIEHLLIQQLTVLETMTPNDFLGFRDHLRPASGFQSAQFRAIEFRSGLKDAAHLPSFHGDGSERTALERRLEEPTLLDAFWRLLAQRGFEIDAAQDPPSDEERHRRIGALVTLYENPRDHRDLYLLAEAMIEYDEMFGAWRQRHVMMAERMIGAKTGTGGSEGVGYLRTTTGRRFFPELWELRSHLGEFGADY